jgi:glyoxylase-like metal-dependent hydrolase (beta-lactamase superfamily II)
VHEAELKGAFYGAATGEDPVFHQPYLDVDLNWVPTHGERTPLFPGLELIHLPGHTAGLQGLLVRLDDSDPLLFVSDQLIFAEHGQGTPQGWLVRDDAAWNASTRTIHRIVASTGARIVYGHDPGNFERFPTSPQLIR